MLVLIGPSGSGKTTIEEELIKRGYKRAISCTTSYPRKGEKHALNYFFISEDKFKENIQKGLMGEFSSYKGHLYGLPISEIKNDAVAVLEPNGYKTLKQKKNLSIYGCYLFCNEDVRRQRMLVRGDLPEQIEERILFDREWFQGMENETDMVIDTSYKTVEEIVDYILKNKQDEVAN